MKARRRMIFVALASAGLAIGGAASAATGPAHLTDAQLDSVTAGGVSVGSSADAAGVGAFTLGGTATNAIAVGGATPEQPGQVSGAGIADGVAVAVGTNFGFGGAPPAGTSTNVQTGGTADGNITHTTNLNVTIQSAGGVRVQLGWTYVFGGFVGL